MDFQVHPGIRIFPFPGRPEQVHGEGAVGTDLVHVTLDQELIQMEHVIPEGDHAVQTVEGHPADAPFLHFQGEVPAGVVQLPFQLGHDVQFAADFRRVVQGHGKELGIGLTSAGRCSPGRQ